LLVDQVRIFSQGPRNDLNEDWSEYGMPLHHLEVGLHGEDAEFVIGLLVLASGAALGEQDQEIVGDAGLDEIASPQEYLEKKLTRVFEKVNISKEFVRLTTIAVLGKEEKGEKTDLVHGTNEPFVIGREAVGKRSDLVHQILF
jgi:hypothetical protein